MKIEAGDTLSISNLSSNKDVVRTDSPVKIASIDIAEKVQRTEKRIDQYTEQRADQLPDQFPVHMTESEKKDLIVSDKVVIDAIEKANKALSVSNLKFEYSIHKKTKQIMVKVLDPETNEVIRELPPEKILDMVAKICEMAGIMVDKRG